MTKNGPPGGFAPNAGSSGGRGPGTEPPALVEVNGFEPMTSGLQSRRSPD